MFVSRYSIPGSCVSGAICDGVNGGQVQHVPVPPGIPEPYHVVKMNFSDCVCVYENLFVGKKSFYVLAYRDMVWKSELCT